MSAIHQSSPCSQEEIDDGFSDLEETDDGFGIAACTATGLPSGEYVLAATLTDGSTIYSAASVQARFAITSLSPAVGSTAGGTLLTITGVHLCTGVASLS
jgi:hypothetical protein